MKITLLLMFSLTLFSLHAQEEKPVPLTVTGYLDLYYTYDFNRPKSNNRPAFNYSYNRANEVAINLAFVKVAYATEKIRANLSLMTGTYANDNLATEPGVLKNIFEANAGVKLSAKKNLWVDAGVFPSHIGFESAIGKDCWNLTRSILADNTPYFETGAKISYTTDDDRWFFSGMILNGWQRIERISGNTIPSFGTQVTFKPSAKVTLNSSTFLGSNLPDSARRVRYFHNFYGIFQLSDKVGVTAGFDSGIQQNTVKSDGYRNWYSPVLIVRAALKDKFTVALRGEYYSDKSGVIIYTGTQHGFRTTGVSANLDFKITDNALWRIEARSLNSQDAVFKKDSKYVSSNTFVSTSLAIAF